MVVENAKTHIPINGRYQPLGGQCDKDTFVFKMKEESVIINPYYLKVLRNQNVKTQTYIISSDSKCLPLEWEGRIVYDIFGSHYLINQALTRLHVVFSALKRWNIFVWNMETYKFFSIWNHQKWLT